MFSRKRIRDKYVSWRKLFLQNWSLFKASRIGLVGLGIMIAFIIIAFLAPFMGLRDPLYWLAPETDTIAVKEWWSFEVRPDNPYLWGQNGTSDHAVGFSTFVYQSGGDPRAGRIYVAEADKIFALDPSNYGLPVWGCVAFQADSRVTTDPVVLNYGDFRGIPLADQYLLFGTEAGTVYAGPDNTADCPVPLTRNLGAPITGIAALTVDLLPGNTTRDAFVVGTADGRLLAYTVHDVNGTFYQELWNTTLSVGYPVLLAGSVVRTNAGAPTSSPAFYYSGVNESRLGEAVYAGTGDGRVWGIWMSNGTVRPGWPAILADGAPLSSPPVVQPGAELTPSVPTLVYVATKEKPQSQGGTNVTKAYVLYADNGRPLDTWRDAAGAASDGGLPITYRGFATGVPNSPVVYGATIYLTTRDGWLYALNRDPVRGLSNEIKTPAAGVLWAFRDDSYRHDASHQTVFTASPYFFNDLTLLIATGSYNNGTAQPWDDLGLIYVFNGATGSLTWKKSFPHGLYGMAPAWKDRVNTLPAVWFATYRGDVYSYSIAGQFLAPLPPNWASSRPYTSGNYYILGTDARGRDIFSQLIWGSRIALLVGFASAFFTISIGVIIGLVAGFLGGRVESVLMRFTDVILVIPGLPLVIILAAVLGAGIGNIILVISIVGWPGVARVIRAEVLSLKERPFIDSARVTGASNVRIMFRHIAPNVAPLAFLYMTFSVSGAILTEAALSFIGLGDINTMSWGIMLQLVSQSKALTAWWWLLPPGLAITLISLAFFLVGRAFDEIVNPRLRKR